jgi:hypothetical protein
MWTVLRECIELVAQNGMSSVETSGYLLRSKNRLRQERVRDRLCSRNVTVK